MTVKLPEKANKQRSTNAMVPSTGTTRLPMLDRIYVKDAIAGLKGLPDQSVDLIVTDPPYNIASKNRRTISKGRWITTQESFGSWDILHPFDHEILLLQLISEGYRVLKPGGSCYIFTAREENGYYVRKAVERGFTYRNQIAIVKTPAMLSLFKNTWRNGFDVCMFLTKGKMGAFNFPGHAEAVNVYKHHIRQKYTDHPTEKPRELIKRFVAVSSNPGDLIVDPFMGSGTTAVACKALKRHFIGFEINPDYVKMARSRLRELRAPSKPVSLNNRPSLKKRA